MTSPLRTGLFFIFTPKERTWWFYSWALVLLLSFHLAHRCFFILLSLSTPFTMRDSSLGPLANSFFFLLLTPLSCLLVIAFHQLLIQKSLQPILLLHNLFVSRKIGRSFYRSINFKSNEKFSLLKIFLCIPDFVHAAVPLFHFAQCSQLNSHMCSQKTLISGEPLRGPSKCLFILLDHFALEA